MKKIIEKGIHIGYEIGSDIRIHNHIHSPESWMITIRALKIHGEEICKKTATEEEIKMRISAKLSIINRISSQLIQETNA